MFTGTVVLCVALIGSDSAWLIIPLMVLIIVIAVVTMIGVFFRADTNPAGLMLTNVSGPEYEAIQRLTLGSSSEGERVELVGGAGAIVGTASEVGTPDQYSGDVEQR